MPQNSSPSCIKREGVIGGGDIHYAANHHGSCFQHLGVAGVKNPRRADFIDIRGIDFVQTAVATAGVVAVIGSPVGTDRFREQVISTHIGDSVDGRLFVLRGGGQSVQSAGGGQQDQGQCFAA